MKWNRETHNDTTYYMFVSIFRLNLKCISRVYILHHWLCVCMILVVEHVSKKPFYLYFYMRVCHSCIIASIRFPSHINQRKEDKKKPFVCSFWLCFFLINRSPTETNWSFHGSYLFMLRFKLVIRMVHNISWFSISYLKQV